MPGSLDCKGPPVMPLASQQCVNWPQKARTSVTLIIWRHSCAVMADDYITCDRQNPSKEGAEPSL